MDIGASTARLQRIRRFCRRTSGMVGSAVVRCLQNRGFVEIVTAGKDELDLLDQRAVASFSRLEKSMR